MVTVTPTIEDEYETVPNLSIRMVTLSMTLNNPYNHDFKVTPLAYCTLNNLETVRHPNILPIHL